MDKPASLMQTWLGDQIPPAEPSILAWVFMAMVVASSVVLARLIVARRRQLARVADQAFIALIASIRRAFRATVRYAKRIDAGSK